MLKLCSRLQDCPYSGCLRQYPELMLLRHLIWRSVPCQFPPCHVKITVPNKTKHLYDMLGIASKFPRMLPDGSPASDLHARSWLLQKSGSVILKQLSQALNIAPLPKDDDGVTRCVFSHLQAFAFLKCCSTDCLRS
jgi:hypothetical protein